MNKVRNLGDLSGIIFFILFLLFQIFIISYLFRKLLTRKLGKFLSFILAYILSEIFLLIIAYIIFLLFTGHIFPRISILQVVLYYVGGISYWGESKIIY